MGRYVYSPRFCASESMEDVMPKIPWTQIQRSQMNEDARSTGYGSASWDNWVQDDLAEATAGGDYSPSIKPQRGYKVYSARDMQLNPDRYQNLTVFNPNGYYISDEGQNLRFMGPFRTVEPARGLRSARQSTRR